MRLFSLNLQLHHHHTTEDSGEGRELSAVEARLLWEAEVRKHDRQVFLDACHPFLLVVFACLASLVLLLARFLAPDACIANASVSCWCVFILCIIALWPCCLCLVFLGQHLFQLLSSIESLEKVMYVLKRISICMSTFLWAALSLGAWFVVFQINPLPAHTSTGESRTLNPVVADWITRIFVAIFIHTFISLLKMSFVSKTEFKSRNEAYYQKVQDAVRVGFVLAKLTKSIPASEFKQAKYRESRRGSQTDITAASAVTLPTIPVVTLPLSFSLDNSDGALSIDWKKLDLDAKAVQETPLQVCGGGKYISSQLDAEVLGEILFNYLKRTVANPDYLTIDDLQVVFPDTSDQAFISVAFALLDEHKRGFVSKKELMARCRSLWLERKNLSRTLEGLDSIIRALSAFLTAISYFLLLFIVLAIFATSSIGKILLSFTATFLAISFAFGESAKNFFNSFVFLFMRHPFDIGDRVVIMGESESMYVHKMELLSTTFMHWDGRMFITPNHVLYTKTIINVRRSRNMTDVYDFQVDFRTPVDSIKALERSWKQYLGTRPDLFVQAKSDMFVKTLENTNRLTIEFIVGYNTNWQYAEQMIRRHVIVLKTKEFCDELAITYAKPVQRIQLLMRDSVRHRGPEPNAPSPTDISPKPQPAQDSSATSRKSPARHSVRFDIQQDM